MSAWIICDWYYMVGDGFDGICTRNDRYARVAGKI